MPLCRANHANGCPHRFVSPYTVGPCPAHKGASKAAAKKAAGQECVLWVAQAPVVRGEELCYGYSVWMPQDRSLLQYGFLQVRAGRL